jgi:predicted ATPase
LIKQVLAPHAGDLEGILATLQAGEFIYEQPVAAGVEYTFKHALTQEVAYNSLLIGRRKVLHERAAAAIDSLYADCIDDYLSVLAHHYERSDNLEKAIEHLGRASQQALQRAAYTDALANFSAAIQLLHKLPDSPERIERELRLQLAVAPALIIVKGWGAPEVERAYTRAWELCELAGDARNFFPFCWDCGSCI